LLAHQESVLKRISPPFQRPSSIRFEPAFKLGDGGKHEPAATNEPELGPNVLVEEVGRDAQCIGSLVGDPQRESRRSKPCGWRLATGSQLSALRSLSDISAEL
jgi:hypothetical protein